MTHVMTHVKWPRKFNQIAINTITYYYIDVSSGCGMKQKWKKKKNMEFIHWFINKS